MISLMLCYFQVRSCAWWDAQEFQLPGCRLLKFEHCKTWNAPSFLLKNPRLVQALEENYEAGCPKLLIHDSYGVLAPFCCCKKLLNQPNSVTKVCSKRHSISFALSRSSGASWKHLPVKPQGVESRQMLSLTVGVTGSTFAMETSSQPHKIKES